MLDAKYLPIGTAFFPRRGNSIGADTGTAVAEDYQVPFRFTGKLDKLTLTIDRPTLTPADIEKMKQATRNNRAAE